MNDLETLRELGAEVDPPTGSPPDRLRGRVVSAMARPRHGVRLRVPRLGWRLAATGGLAVALAAALLAVQTLGIGEHPPAANAEAATILRNAAAAAQKQPDVVPRPDQFVYVESLTAHPTAVAGEGGRTKTIKIEPKLRRIWLSVDGSGDGVLRERPRAGGSWAQWPVPGCRNGKATFPADGSTKTMSCLPNPAYRGDLPMDTEAMYRYLFANSDGKTSPNMRAFHTVGFLIQESDLPARSIAALFNAAAKIPGTTVVPDAVDTAGRHGIAVAQTAGGIRRELIFDSATYQYLGDRVVAVDDGHLRSGAAQLRIAIVDLAGHLP